MGCIRRPSPPRISWPVALAALILAAPRGAGAQPMLGGVGGDLIAFPGSTVEGDILRGGGLLAAGLGRYNLALAQAQAINADTSMRVNEYLYESRMIMRQRYFDTVRAEHRRRAELGRLRDRRIEQAPVESDITSGDALNRMIEAFAAAQVAPSMLRLEALDLPVELVQATPYFYPSVGGVISLRRLVPPDDEWPLALRDPRLESRRSRYRDAVHHALEQVEKARLGIDDVRQIRDAIDGLRGSMAELDLGAEQAAFHEVHAFLRLLDQLALALQHSAGSVALNGLDGYHGTTVFDLVSYMQAFNLRFAPARTPVERTTYIELHRILAQQRRALNLERGADPARDFK